MHCNMCMYMYSRLHTVHFALLCLPTLFTIFHAIIWNHVAKSKRCMEAANFNLRNVAQFPSKIAGKGGYQSPFWLENQNIQNKEKAPRTWAPLPLTFCIKITGLKLDHAFNSVLKNRENCIHWKYLENWYHNKKVGKNWCYHV